MRAIFVTVAIVLACTAQAQTTNPPDTPTHSQSPSSSMNNPSTTGTANYSNGSGDDKWQLKSCLAKQKAANPQLSKGQMKENCAKLKPTQGQ
jgi:hypothetical protein